MGLVNISCEAIRADDGTVVTDSPNMARILANHSASALRTADEKDHPSLPEPSTIINVPHLTPAVVHTELSTFYMVEASGPDDLHPFMLPILADFLAEPFSVLNNKSLQSGEVPQDWRKAIVCPVFKKGTRRMEPLPLCGVNFCFV